MPIAGASPQSSHSGQILEAAHAFGVIHRDWGGVIQIQLIYVAATEHSTSSAGLRYGFRDPGQGALGPGEGRPQPAHPPRVSAARTPSRSACIAA
jgi:hypothetical protein